MTQITHRFADRPIPPVVKSVGRKAAITYGLVLAIPVLFWTVFNTLGNGLTFFAWFTPVVVLSVAAAPFAAGAIVYAVADELLQRCDVPVDRPIVVGLLLFISLGIGAAAISPFVSNPFLPYSGWGAFNGGLVASFVTVLARTGHFTHDPE